MAGAAGATHMQCLGIARLLRLSDSLMHAARPSRSTPAQQDDTGRFLARLVDAAVISSLLADELIAIGLIEEKAAERRPHELARPRRRDEVAILVGSQSITCAIARIGLRREHHFSSRRRRRPSQTRISSRSHLARCASPENTDVIFQRQIAIDTRASSFSVRH